MVRKLFARKAEPVRFSRGGKLQGLGKNSSVKITGARGRRVSIPRSADSFRSRTDNT